MKWLAICLIVFVQVTNSERTASETLEWWREAILLDLPGDVLREEAAVSQRHPELALHGEALALRARARSLAGLHDDARELLMRSRPEQAAIFVEVGLARLDLEEDKLAAVVQRLKSKQSVEPDEALRDHAEAWLILGRALARAGAVDDAAILLKRFVELDPLHPEAASAWHMLAQHAIRARDSQRAARFSDRADRIGKWHAFYRAHRLRIRENAEAVTPRIGIVILWMQADQPAKALEILDELALLDPENCQAFGHRAEALRKLERFKQARTAYDSALECDPQNAGLHFNRGWLALQEKHEADAKKDFEWIVESEHAEEHRYLDAHLKLARILIVFGEVEEAQKRHAKYVELGGTEDLDAGE